MSAVVMSFILATVVGEYMNSAIASRVRDMIGNAMPSVQLLGSARGDLGRLDLDLDEYAGAPDDRRSVLRDRLIGSRNDVEAALASYVSLPLFPNEWPLFAHVQEGTAAVDTTLANYLAGAPTDRTGLQHVHQQVELLDQAIDRVVSFDASQGQRLGLEIEGIRSETRAVVVLLAGLSVMLAIVAVFLSLRQLRRIARLERAERNALELRDRELSAENEALGQFAGSVAHDILSPLASAMLALDMVHESGDVDAESRRSAERGIMAVTRVKRLVDALLAFSRAGGRPEPGVSTEVAPVIADIVEGLGQQAREANITLIASSVPAGAIACSEGVLTSVVSNLVTNAIKHMGNATQRRVDVRAFDLGTRWRFEVEDTGPGISPEQQAKIFQPYVQLDRGASGIGLGLATVDRLVRAHGGTVGVQSRGPGSLFWFELPKPAIATPVQYQLLIPAT
ncbi:MAG TPA: HAMP domain-containing sensor histidine kinase [Kofleriaceae bacterium]|nr:HAMP domain-containing sensor histidine kinase [Kofleriaceae bacterium]